MSATADRLPYVDEHSAVVEATPAVTWDALLHVAEASMSSPVTPPLARLLGCADLAATGPRPLTTGSAFPGFHVGEAVAPAKLELLGSHHFSNYALIFHLEEIEGGHMRLRAETRAEFPKLRGSVYRALVIGTRMHVLATRRVLTATQRRAER
jgi:hypothetical protein